jgi:hypothetical protein
MPWWRRTAAPVAREPAAVSPRIVPLQPRRLADQLLLTSLKMREYSADAAVDDPRAHPPPAAEGSGGHPLPLAHIDYSGLPSVPADLAEEVAELMAPLAPPPQDAAAGAAALGAAGGAAAAAPAAIPMPDSERLPVSSRAQALARVGGLPQSSRRTSAMLRSVEGQEVTVLRNTALARSAVYATTLKRLKALSPPGHYSGLLGAARRSRLWWRVNGWFVGSVVIAVVLGAGVLALCVFSPIVGIIVVANVILISGAAGAAAGATRRA